MSSNICKSFSNFFFQVDKHIRRLDSDLAKFEAEIKEKAITNNKKEDEISKTKSTSHKFLLIDGRLLMNTFQNARKNHLLAYQRINEKKKKKQRKGKRRKSLNLPLHLFFLD